MAGAAFRDAYCWSADSVRLHWRDYPGPADRPALICVPGLTGTARAFEPLALRLAGRWRILAVDLRGRGDSGHARDALTYVPLAYLQDLGRVIEAAGHDRIVAVGLSTGGVPVMLLGSPHSARLAGLVLIDVGPDLDPVGLARLRAQVSHGGGWPTWLHAAREMAEQESDVHPGWGLHDWVRHAKRTCRVGSTGRIEPDHDPRIAEPFRLPGSEPGLDLWRALAAFEELPVLSLRAERSDLLTAATQARLAEALPRLRSVELSGVSHPPTLDEPETLDAIERFLADVR